MFYSFKIQIVVIKINVLYTLKLIFFCWETLDFHAEQSLFSFPISKEFKQLIQFNALRAKSNKKSILKNRIHPNPYARRSPNSLIDFPSHTKRIRHFTYCSWPNKDSQSTIT